MANKPQTVSWTPTSTAETDPAYVSFPTACQKAYATFSNVTTSTKSSVKLQGSIGGSGVWFNLSALTTLTTGEDSFGSTAATVFDKVRVQVTGKTTNTGTNYAYIIAG